MRTGKYALPLLWLLMAGFRVAGQDYFYKVYGYETVARGHVGLQLRNGCIPPVSGMPVGHMGSRGTVWAHSAGMGLGITDHLEVGAYADFLKSGNEQLSYMQSHFSALYRFGQRYDHFINIGLYAEYYIPASSFSHSQQAGLRLIMDKDLGDIRLVLNPMVSVYTTGGEDRALQPGVAAGMYYRRFRVVQPGVEYFSNFRYSLASLFPVVNIFITPRIVWNIGTGFGLGPEAEKLTLKSMLQFDVQALRPSQLMMTRKRPAISGMVRQHILSLND